MTDEAAAQSLPATPPSGPGEVPGTIAFTFQWTERGWFRWARDYNCQVLGRKFNWVSFRWVILPLPLVIAGGFVVVNILGLGPVQLPNTPTPGQSMLAVLPWCAGWAAAIPVAHLIHYWMIRRVFRKNPSLSLRQEWTINANRLSFRTAQNTQTLEWSGVRNIIQLGSGFWLSQGAHTGLFVPRQPIEQTGQLEAFRTLLDKRGPARPRS